MVLYTQIRMSGCRFREIEHTADWGLHLEADDLGQLLECAALGMFGLLGLEPVDGHEEVRNLQLEAPDREGLLVSWLEELLYYLETEGLMPLAMTVHTNADTVLEAELRLAAASGASKQIKAVTYHDLSIDDRDTGLETTIVFDV